MFTRRLAASAALALAGLTTAAPVAGASTPQATTQPRDTDIDYDGGGVSLLDDSTVLPVNACGLGVGILGDVLGTSDADCGIDASDEDD